MKDGGNFKEHKGRFLPPIPGQTAESSRGKCFTPNIQDYRIVDFRGAGFSARDKDPFRLVVVFAADYGGCQVWNKGRRIFDVRFGGSP